MSHNIFIGRSINDENEERRGVGVAWQRRLTWRRGRRRRLSTAYMAGARRSGVHGELTGARKAITA